MKRIAVIGSLNIDFVVDVERTPQAGETLLARDFKLIPGGKGANQACALGRLGADVVMLGAVGDDLYGELEQKSLRESGVDISRLRVLRGESTGIALITVNAQGDNTIVVIQGANRQVTPEYIDSCMDLLEGCDAVLFQLEIPLETVVYAAKKCKSLGKTVFLDPAPAVPDLPKELLCCVDVIKPNETELGIITGMPDAKDRLPEAAALLHRAGVGCVLVTLGSAGAYVSPREGEGRLIPARPVKAVDTTAAGDSFTGAAAMRMMEGEEIMKAVEFANLVSSIVVTRRGAQSSIPSIAEVEALLPKT